MRNKNEFIQPQPRVRLVGNGTESARYKVHDCGKCYHKLCGIRDLLLSLKQNCQANEKEIDNDNELVQHWQFFQSLGNRPLDIADLSILLNERSKIAAPT